MSTDKFIENIENSMKSGYISMLILLALEKEPANGYKLMKLISEDTFGEWKPTNSTIYPYLSTLTEKGLVEYEEKKTGKRESKEYSLTIKGKEILTKLVEKQQEMNLSLLSMISAVTNIKSIPNHLLNQSFQQTILMNKSDKEKIEIINRRIEMLDLMLKIFENNKVEMEKKLATLKAN